ncbi:MAG: hypothetical protein ACI8PZ_003777 [Myxococcota bacterium]|jgi:hypothetical protein
MRNALILSFLALGACGEQEFNITPNAEVVPGPATLNGRVCDPITQRWVDGAMVYTNLFDDSGVVYDTALTFTDDSGRWSLEVPGGRTYNVYVQIANDVIDQVEVTPPEGEIIDLPDPACFQPTDANIAVISGDWDDLGSVFPAIGIEEWTVVDGQGGVEIIDFLTDEASLAEYDAIFFDGGHLEEGIFYGAPDDETVAAVHSALKGWVRDGGYLFASDWSYDVVEQLWPDEIDFYGNDDVPDQAQVGEPGMVSADVLDADLASVIGSPLVELTYDVPVWPVAESSSAKVWMTGSAKFRVGFEVSTMEDSPLLVSFEKGEGRVVFTSFRLAVNDDPNLRKSLAVLLEGVL